MDFDPDCSYQSYQTNESTNNTDPELDCAISGLRKCLHEYNEKAQENNRILETLGWDARLLPQDVKNTLKDIFLDNEVFSVNEVGSKEMITLNPLYMRDSLTVNQELSDVWTARNQLDSILSQIQLNNNKLQWKLESEKAQAEVLNEKVAEKTAENTILKSKMEQQQRDIEHLLQEAQVLEKPRFTLEDLQDLHEELKKLNGETSIVKTKLEKYNNLPLTEKEASKQIQLLKQELSDVKSEISKKVSEAHFQVT